jgi:hypothetical protein
MQRKIYFLLIDKLVCVSKKIYGRILEQNTLIELLPTGKPKGYVLLSYIVAPFIFKGEFSRHSNYWECREMANIWINSGFAVHVINWDDKKFIPKIKYNFFIDIHDNLERLNFQINHDCIKILHITNSHWLHQNYMEYQRINEIKKRKKVILLPRRIITPCKGVEYAHFATILGNSVTMNSYKPSNKKFFQLPVTSVKLFDFNENKEISRSKNNFLWMGSDGLVLKGLDLVLETFKNMPNCNLYICGSIEKESDFVDLYRNELYFTSNIHYCGWIDVTSQKFQNLLSSVIGIVFPSASEGQSGSVIQCMHGGLIPIISKYCGIDIYDFGIIIESLTIESIQKAINEILNKNESTLFEMSKKSWTYARNYHTRECFSKEYQNFVNLIKDSNINS